MPAIDQREIAQVGPVTALASTLEIFDKYKTEPEDEKSDSEESFHLPMLDDDEVENKSIISNGKDKDSCSQNDETEEDILNKFETLNSATPENLDSKITEDSILNDVVEESAESVPLNNKENGDSSSYASCDSKDDKDEVKETQAEEVEIVTEKQKEEVQAQSVDSRFLLKITSKYDKTVPILAIKAPDVFDKYEESNDSGEFMSIYESENLSKQIENFEKDVESMEVDEIQNFHTESNNDIHPVTENSENLDGEASNISTSSKNDSVENVTNQNKESIEENEDVNMETYTNENPHEPEESETSNNTENIVKEYEFCDIENPKECTTELEEMDDINEDDVKMHDETAIVNTEETIDQDDDKQIDDHQMQKDTSDTKNGMETEENESMDKDEENINSENEVKHGMETEENDSIGKDEEKINGENEIGGEDLDVKEVLNVNKQECSNTDHAVQELMEADDVNMVDQTDVNNPTINEESPIIDGAETDKEHLEEVIQEDTVDTIPHETEVSNTPKEPSEKVCDDKNEQVAQICLVDTDSADAKGDVQTDSLEEVQLSEDKDDLTEDTLVQESSKHNDDEENSLERVQFSENKCDDLTKDALIVQEFSEHNDDETLGTVEKTESHEHQDEQKEIVLQEVQPIEEKVDLNEDTLEKTQSNEDKEDKLTEIALEDAEGKCEDTKIATSSQEVIGETDKGTSVQGQSNEDPLEALDSENKLNGPDTEPSESLTSVHMPDQLKNISDDAENSKEADKLEKTKIETTASNELEDPLLKELEETINTPSSFVESSKLETVDDQTAVCKEPHDDISEEKGALEESVAPKPEDENVFAKPEDKLSDPPDKCEVSNDSTKNEDMEDDLLDISIIRDTEEDDACAIATAIEDNTAMAAASDQAEAHSSDKSDNDDLDDRSETTAFDAEDSEMDKDDDHDDHDNEPMDFDDASNIESCDQDTGVEMLTSDSESKSTDVAEKDKRFSDFTDATAKSSENEQNNTVGLNARSESLNKEKVDLEVDSGVCEGSDKTGENSSESMQDVDNSSSKKINNNISRIIEPLTKDVEKSPDVTASTEITETTKGNKRSLSQNDINLESSSKKMKLTDTVFSQETVPDNNSVPLVQRVAAITAAISKADKVKTLTAFEIFMQNRKMKTKLTRSDLEQFCIQKICESIVLKSSDGELHQTIKKQEKIIETLRKDLQQLTKQAKDLEIVNKKLMSELRIQNSQPAVAKKPLVPLRITRSVGLQVRLNVVGDPPPPVRRRQAGTATPQKATPASPANVTSTVNTPPATVNRGRVAQVPSPAVRQVMTSPQKTTPTPANNNQTNATTNTPTTPLLSQALQNRARTLTGVAAKRTTQIRPKPKASTPSTPEPAKSPGAAAKPANPGVIDLTDEDDRTKVATTQPVKILNKAVGAQMMQNKTGTTVLNKQIGAKTTLIGQPKTAPAGTKVGAKVATPTRTVTALPQGVRLTPQQMKNGGIAIPVSSAGGTTQLMYVLPTITNAGGAQKLAFVNIQPANGGVLPAALNGSAVSVVANKQGGNTLTLKTVSAVRKHPAPLPTPPRVVLDANLKPVLPKPHLTIRKTDTGIILQWKMPYNLEQYENIASYQLYAYQETNSPPSTDMWRKVGDVKALALPMACTLTQFADKNKYYFAVRSVDVHKRIGAFSDPEEISL